MSSRLEKIVIAGAGQAGATVALGLRKAGFCGKVTLVGQEAHLPYERPQLSKDMLRPNPTLRAIKSQDDYVGQQIELALARKVTNVDVNAQRVILDDGGALDYDRLVIATGTQPRKLSQCFDEPERVRYLRTLEDALRLQQDIQSGKSLAIMGGGVIGLEVAAAARAAGCDVTLIEASDQLMARSVDRTVSDYLLRAHRANGVDIRCNVHAVELKHGGLLQLSNGECVRAERVLVGVGVAPNLEGFHHLGITDALGVRVDETGRSAIANIYATGDVASQPYGDTYGRIETWANAQDHALNVVNNLLGEHAPYRSATWFWSDQGRINLQVVGNARRGTRVIRGNPFGESFSVFWLDQSQRLTGCSSINAPKDMALARRWAKQGDVLNPGRLADLAAPLRDCVA